MTRIESPTDQVRVAGAYAKPLLRGWLHLLCFEVSLVVGTVLIADTPGHARWPVIVYVGAVCALFGTSALYHRGRWGPQAHRRLQRLDHVMIFVLIAGTATPVFALAVSGAWSGALLSGIWALTGLAMITHVIWMEAPEKLVRSTYIGLGVLGSAALPAVWLNDGTAPAILICAGGVMYIVGAVLYHRRRPDPSPEVFGYHEVFHGFVCAGATLQYVAIACFIVR